MSKTPKKEDKGKKKTKDLKVAKETAEALSDSELDSVKGGVKLAAGITVGSTCMCPRVGEGATEACLGRARRL